MTSPLRKLRLAYRVDPEPVNGWLLSHCEALDLVSQGRTAEQARALLHEEAQLYLAQVQALGTLQPLLEQLAAQQAAAGTPALELDMPGRS